MTCSPGISPNGSPLQKSPLPDSSTPQPALGFLTISLHTIDHQPRGAITFAHNGCRKLRAYNAPMNYLFGYSAQTETRNESIKGNATIEDDFVHVEDLSARAQLKDKLVDFRKEVNQLHSFLSQGNPCSVLTNESKELNKLFSEIDRLLLKFESAYSDNAMYIRDFEIFPNFNCEDVAMEALDTTLEKIQRDFKTLRSDWSEKKSGILREIYEKMQQKELKDFEHDLKKMQPKFCDENHMQARKAARSGMPSPVSENPEEWVMVEDQDCMEKAEIVTHQDAIERFHKINHGYGIGIEREESRRSKLDHLKLALNHYTPLLQLI